MEYKESNLKTNNISTADGKFFIQFGSIFAGVALILMLTFSLFDYSGSNSVQTEAVIADVYSWKSHGYNHNGYKDTSHATYVQFYTEDGEKIEAYVDDYKSWLDPGDKVNVTYDRDNPYNVDIVDGIGFKIFIYLFLSIFLIIGLVSIRSGMKIIRYNRLHGIIDTNISTTSHIKERNTKDKVDNDYEKPEKPMSIKHRKIIIFMSGILLALSFVLIVGTFKEFVGLQRFNENSVETTAVVTGFEHSDGGSPKTIIEFYTEDGERIETKYHTWSSSYHKGTEIDIKYDPNNPEELDDSIVNVIVYTIFAIILGFAGIKMLGWISHDNKIRKSQQNMEV